MHLVYTYIALDLANDRAREARDARRAAHVIDVDERPSALRRGLAHGLASLSRASAAAAHRLDAFSPEELRGTLMAGK